MADDGTGRNRRFARCDIRPGKVEPCLPHAHHCCRAPKHTVLLRVRCKCTPIGQVGRSRFW